VQPDRLPLVVLSLCASLAGPATAQAASTLAPGVQPHPPERGLSGGAVDPLLPASTPAAAQDAPQPAEPKKEGEEPKPGDGKDTEKQAEPKKEGEEPKKEGETKPEDKKPEEKKPLYRSPVQPPLGVAGKSRVAPGGKQEDDHFVPVPDRWRIGFPEWDRYRSGLGAPFSKAKGKWWNPYRQNILKADYPILGQNIFLDFSFTSDTLADYRRLPIPSTVSASTPGQSRFFGRGELQIVDQTFFLSAEIFKGDTAFRPKDWAVRVTPAFNINHVRARENLVVNIDPRDRISRTNADISFQELFGEYKIKDLSRAYDFISARAGIQGFTADFRGFLYVDNQPGFRIFGNTQSNRNQFNLIYLRQLEKDTYSRLNRIFEDRKQDILIANFFRQDLFRPGYTGQFTLAYSHDYESTHFNNNEVRTRPALIGQARPHDIRVGYFGWNGDGHIGRLNLTHSFYQAVGRDDRNPIAGRSTRINAQMGAIEASYDVDWLRPKLSFFYASGDANPRDGRARGFDAIFDNPIFAGGGFSFWQSSGIRLTGTNVDLTSENSLIPNLRASKIEGQANFVNPGVFLVNAGLDAELTPKWRVSANVNWLNFAKTQPLELVLFQSNINRSIGFDYSLGVRHRPFLNDNVILTFGASALVPGAGFRDIYSNKTLFSAFARLTLTY